MPHIEVPKTFLLTVAATRLDGGSVHATAEVHGKDLRDAMDNGDIDPINEVQDDSAQFSKVVMTIEEKRS